MNIEKLGRLWQFVGVAIATHVATRHAMIWGHSEGEGGAGIPASWTRFLIGKRGCRRPFLDRRLYREQNPQAPGKRLNSPHMTHPV